MEQSIESLQALVVSFNNDSLLGAKVHVDGKEYTIAELQKIILEQLNINKQ